MATTQKYYRLGQRKPRNVTKLTTFNKGMYITNQVLPEGYAKHMVNYDINATGTHLTPKRGRKLIQVVQDVDDTIDMRRIGVADCNSQHVLTNTDFLNFYVTEPLVSDEETIEGIKDVVYNAYGTGFTQNPVAEVEDYIPIKGSAYPTQRTIKDAVAFNKPVGPVTVEDDFRSREPLYKPISTVLNNDLYIIEGPLKKLKLSADKYTTNQNVVYYDNFRFVSEEITPQELNPAEAYTNGYNMYSTFPYVFSNEVGSSLNILGALPYSAGTSTPVLNPLTGSIIDIKVYYQYVAGTTIHAVLKVYNLDDPSSSIVTVAEETEAAGATPITFSSVSLPYTNNQFIIELNTTASTSTLVNFPLPIKCATDEKNIFDFSQTFELTSAKGMISWYNYIGLYGVYNAPGTIFFSDIENPSYFPFPNNVIQLNSTILAVYNYLDYLLVVTVDSLYLITIGSSIATSTVKCILNNIYIPEIDAINIQILKDQIFFKTADQFYVLKPNMNTSDATDLKNYVNSTAIDDLTKNFTEEVLKIVNRVYEPKLQEFINSKHKDVYINDFDITDVRSCIMDEEVHYIYYLNLRFNENISTIPDSDYSTLLYQAHDLFEYTYRAHEIIQIARTYMLDHETPTPEVLRYYDFDCDGEITQDDIDKAYLMRKPCIDYYDQIVQANCSSVALHLVYNTLTRSWRLYLKPMQGMDFDYVRQAVTIPSKVYYKNKQTGDFYEFFTVNNRENESTYCYGIPHYFKVKDLTQNGTVDYVIPDTDLITHPDDWAAYTVNPVTGEQLGGNTIKKELAISLYSAIVEHGGYLTVGTGVLPNGKYNTYEIFRITYEETKDDVKLAINVPAYKNESFEKDGNKNMYLNGTFDAYTYIDTGNVTLEDLDNKRFREVQFNLVNGEATSIPFYANFQADGKETINATRYQIQHITDPSDPDYGLIYVIPLESSDLNFNVVATEEVNLIDYGASILANSVVESDHWALDLSKFPDLTMCTVRFELKGKGRRGSLQLLNTSLKRYELADINWVYRTMSAR